MFAGSFIEEAISPIPSFVVLLPAGAAAQVQGVSWWYIPVLALIAACGRIIASVILYVIADKGKDWLFNSGRKFFGVTHKQLERYGRRLSGSNRDLLVLFLFNAIPVLPTSLLSLACGFIKVRFRIFLIATFWGTVVNASIYLAIGFAGVRVASALQNLELVFQIVAIVISVSLLVWLFRYQAKKRSR